MFRYGDIKVLIDNEEVGVLRNGDVKVFPVDAGTHKLKLKKMWIGSPVKEFEVKEFDEKKFNCGPALSGAALIPFIMLFYVTFLSQKAIWLEEEKDIKPTFEMEYV
ncbi:MAG: hypothetical protein R6V01_01340 [Thermoplasmatota archaeon]